ncbi:MAG: ATP-binding protein [Nitrosopumilus sp. (ex Thoosa mismalolli)]|nr:ATP-binding protein [Nitrosopumilus sp. (ex Thoosa mismalolli)]
MFQNKKSVKWYAITSTIIILLAIITIQIYSIEEQNIKNTIIKNQIEIQEIITKSISKNISTELELIVFELELLANQNEIQKDIGTKETSKLIEDTFNRLNTISPTAQILALDEDFQVLSQASKRQDSFVGATVRGLSELMESEKDNQDSKAKILSINTALFDEPEIAITFPIINKESNEFKGTLLVTFPASEFFKRHGNIYDIESQFLMVMDEKRVLLIHPNIENVGKKFFEEEIQRDISENSILNQHISNIFEGNLSTVIFTLEDDIGERINSGILVNVNSNNEFLFGVVTPTQSINQEIDEIIFLTKIQTVFLLLSTITALLVFLIKRTQSFKKEKLSVIGQLSSNIAHDIRNPLATIKNAGVVIEKENKNQNEVISREIKRMNLSIRRISHQVEEVLNYVRSTPIILKEHSIKQTIQEALETLDLPLNIKINISEKDVIVKIHYEKMLIVFVNIILNAIQSIGEKEGQVIIRIKESSSNIVIEFENSGPNIPEKDLKRIFDTLYTTKLEGTGLGLSSCKNIVEQHKGTIHASMNPVIFTVIIPK